MKKFLSLSLAFLFSILSASLVSAQQTVYSGFRYHGPFVASNSYDALEYLGPFFEMPKVTAGATGYVQWTKGAVYPDGTVNPTVSTVLAQGSSTDFVALGGLQVNASGASGLALDASKTSCDMPGLSSCDIIIASYYGGVPGAATGTFVVGEKVTQGTSNAVAYVLNVVPAGGPMVLSKVTSGTPDATHTWTGATSSATFVPTAAPSNSSGVAVALVTSAAAANLPGVTVLAYVQTNSSSAPTAITYPYQIASSTQNSYPNYVTNAGVAGPALHSILLTGAVGTAITLSGASAFTGATTFACTASDTTASHAAWVSQASGTSITPGGTGTDAVTLYCIGY